MKTSRIARSFLLASCSALAASAGAQLPTPRPPDTVFLEELTWDELQLLMKGGKTTAIIGTAGTEQKGPHMAIAEHKYATTYAADKIARALGNAIVAPVITYVPEGSWERPTGHMARAGSITLPEERFRMLLELTARSLKSSGFTEIILIGDYYTKAHALQDTYIIDSLKLATRETMGGHANLLDTSELLYIHPELVNKERMATAAGRDGSSGDPSKSTPELGKKLLDMKIELALAQIKLSLETKR